MSISLSYDPTEWRSSDRHSQHKPTEKLTAGDIVVVKREPFRVHEIKSRPHINWNEKYLAAWERSGCPDPETWWHRPFAVTIGKEDAPESKHRWHVEAAGSRFWTVLPEHYAVCRLCGELPPCRHEHTETVMEHVTGQMEEVMRLLPGSCHECGELVRPRQHTVRFEGENLIRPDLGNNSAIFHTARSVCWNGAYLYDKKWADAVPGRRRKLSCGGMAIHHRDGTFECTSGPGCAFENLGHQGGSVHCWAGQGRDCWCLQDGTDLSRPADTEGRTDA